VIPRPDVLIGNLTHVGMERSENQDYYGYYEPEDQEEFKRKGRLIIVCDGMGGHAGGEVASRLAVDTIVDTYKKDQTGNVLEAMRRSIEAANRAIWQHAQENPQLKGMGSTCVALALKEGMAYVGHVGDSRCYLVRNEQLVQITKDHSLVQQMVDEGLLREEEMESHPEKNVILRSLGVKPDVDVDLGYQPVQLGDMFCLSTDGLTGLVSKEECLRICLLQKDNPMEASRLLVDLANKYGGYDNVTVQIARVVKINGQELKQQDAKRGEAYTGVYTPDEVQRSITEAKARAAAVAPVKTAPTAQEMAGNKPAAGRAGQKGITMALAAPTKEELQKAISDVKTAKAPASAPAQGARPGTSKLPLVVGAVVVVAIVALAVVAVKGAIRTGNARGRLALALKEAKSSGLETEELKKAIDRADAALRQADGFLGSILGASDLEQAEERLKKLTGQKTSGKGPDDAEGARKAMLAAKEAARDAKADSEAQVEWSGAEAMSDKAQRALSAQRFEDAVQLFAGAEDAYRRARSAATDSQARLELEAKKASIGTALASAEAAKARELIPELVEGATAARAEAERIQQADTVRALQKLEFAEMLVQAAIRLAPEIEKKN